ncbi:MAG: hypothetical protein ACT452_19875 [Microthrixaceae bacterium]
MTFTTSAPHRDAGARVLVGVVAAYLPFTLLGYGTDIDVANILRAGGTFVRDGRYDISRRPGSIVHELGTGALDQVGGSVAVNLAGVGFAALALWGVLVLAREAGARWAGWAVLLVAVNPWFWLAATSLGDFVWALGFAMAGAVAARRDHRVLAGVLFGLAVGCRLSTVLLALSWLAAERLGDRAVRPSWRATTLTAVVLAAGVVAVLVPSWLDAGRSLDFLGHQPEYPGLRVNLGRWAVKNAAVIGVPAGVVLLLGIPALRASTGRATVERWQTSSTVRFAALVVVTGEVLFLRFPWKPVHLLPVVLGAALLAGSSPAAKGRWVGALVAAQLLGGIVGTTIAEPDVPHHARTGRPVLGRTEGALLNAVRCRLDDRRAGPWPDATDPLQFPAASTRSAILFDCQSEAWKAVP